MELSETVFKRYRCWENMTSLVARFITLLHEVAAAFLVKNHDLLCFGVA